MIYFAFFIIVLYYRFDEEKFVLIIFEEEKKMEITLEEVKNRKALKKFIYLPEKIHAGHEKWVPPIYMDEWKYFDPKKNEAFSYSDGILLLAYQGEKPVGRIMGIINKRYNDYKNEKTARFAYLETYEDEEIVKVLLIRVEQWAREKGMKKLIGPYGFTDQDPEGFMIEGFDSPSTIACYYNYEWMPRFVENQGFVKDIDYFVYKLDVPEELPEFYKKIYERAMKKGNYEIVESQTKKELWKLVKPVFHLLNECYTQSNIYGYTPLDEKEMNALTKRYMPMLDPRFIKGIKMDGELVACIIAIPDMTEGIKKAKGKLFPFGIFKIIRAAKKTKQLDLLLGAVKESLRGRGLDVLMGVKTIMSAQEAGMKVMDTHHEMESNVKVRGGMIKMGGILYKKFRVYKKTL